MKGEGKAARAVLITARRSARRPRRGARGLAVERKFVDYVYNASVVATTAGAEADPATALCLNAIAQGDGESSRDGRQSRIVACQIRGRVARVIASDAADVRAPSTCRVLVVLDKQSNNAQLNSEDVLLDLGGLDVNSPLNLQFTKRFTVLKDRVFELNDAVAFGDGVNTASVAGNNHSFIWNIPVNFTTTYSTTAATIAAVTDMSLHVIAISSGTVDTLAYTSRCRFIG